MTIAQSVLQPAGDGKTDDIAALQAAVDATAPGGTLTLEAGKRYAVSHPVDCRGKTIHIDGAGSTVIITGPNYPDNEAFHFGALLTGTPPVGQPWNSQQYPPPVATFSGQISKGQRSFACTLPADVPVGATVAANFGTCPNDHTLPDVCFLAKIVRSSAGTVTLDTPMPRDVRGDTHSFFGVVSLGDNSSIKNIGLDWVDGVIADEQIAVDYCRHFQAQNLTGRFSIAINAAFSHDITVQGVRGEVVKTSPAAGRVLGGWLMDDFRVSDVVVHQTTLAPVFFFEGNARDGTISNVTINSDAPATAWQQGVLMLDATEDLTVKGLSLNAPKGAQVMVASDGTAYGTNHSGLSVSNLKTNVPLNFGDMREINSGALNNVALGNHVKLHYFVALPGGGQPIQLARGVMRTLSIRVPPHVTAVYFRPSNAGPSVKNPKPGEWISLVDGFADYRWDDPTVAGVGDCAVLDDGQLAPGSQIEVMCDVFPCGQLKAGK